LAALRTARGSVFSDEDVECLYGLRRGRPPHLPSVLAALLLAQALKRSYCRSVSPSRTDVMRKPEMTKNTSPPSPPAGKT
jgi:hypothetical protein